jgi:hypothetical protein
MALKYGRAKHMEAVTPEDCLAHPIWVMAHSSKFGEEGVRPIVNKTHVDREVLRTHCPIITVRLEGTETIGEADYDADSDELTRVALYLDGQWVDAFDHRARLKFPMAFVAVPAILGVSDARFVWKTPKGAIKRIAKAGVRSRTRR